MRPLAILLGFIASLLVTQGALAREWLVERVGGSAWSIGTDRSRTKLEPQMTVPEGRTIETSANGRLRLTSENNVLTLGPNTRASVEPKSFFSSRTRVLQQVGSIEFDIEKRASPHFAVDTPFMAAVVKGTKFTVDVSKRDARIGVSRGLVQVSDLRSGETAGIGIGQKAVASLNARGLKTSGPTAPSVSRGKPSRPAVAPIGENLTGFRSQMTAASVSEAKADTAGGFFTSGSFGFAADANATTSTSSGGRETGRGSGSGTGGGSPSRSAGNSPGGSGNAGNPSKGDSGSPNGNGNSGGDAGGNGSGASEGGNGTGSGGGNTGNAGTGGGGKGNSNGGVGGSGAGGNGDASPGGSGNGSNDAGGNGNSAGNGNSGKGGPGGNGNAGGAGNGKGNSGNGNGNGGGDGSNGHGNSDGNKGDSGGTGNGKGNNGNGNGNGGGDGSNAGGNGKGSDAGGHGKGNGNGKK